MGALDNSSYDYFSCAWLSTFDSYRYHATEWILGRIILRPSQALGA
jgi:hypothetical protein